MYLEQLQLLLVAEALDLRSLHIHFQVQFFLPEKDQSTVEGLMQILNLPLQLLPLVLQLSALQRQSYDYNVTTAWHPCIMLLVLSLR